jgi:hypothetical protein
MEPTIQRGSFALGKKTDLKALKEGEVIITCSNEKGNVFKKMTGVLYDTGVIIVQPKILSSQTNIDQDIYYGEYDLNNKEKVPAKIEFGLTCFPNNLLESLEIVDISNNISVAQNNLDLTVSMTGDLSSLDASFTVRSNIYTTVRPSTYKFKIVEDGVNVYNYDQLLECTNRSKTGEIVVLRKSFVDQKTMLSTNQNNVTMFGGSKKDDYNFKKVYIDNFDINNSSNELYKNNLSPIRNDNKKNKSINLSNANHSSEFLFLNSSIKNDLSETLDKTSSSMNQKKIIILLIKMIKAMKYHLL